MQYILAYDLGTGGIKASLYDENGTSCCTYFCAYPTFYPAPGYHEQRPEDWWQGVCSSTRALLEQSGVAGTALSAVAVSGHSLVAIPMDAQGNALLEQVPIWSDVRASREVEEFFSRIPYEEWYMTTGNGDAPENYSVMKLMWLRKNQPEVWDKTVMTLGSKDYVNFRLTGVAATDYSYASGTGVFDLKTFGYRDDFLENAGVPRLFFREPVSSHEVIGRVTREAAAQTGLPEGLPVVCGGVDNALMALGAQGSGEGKVYTSLGSSAWIAVTSGKPVLDLQTRPFIFAFVEKGCYTSGVSIFSAGSSHRWSRDVFCRDLMERADCFRLMDDMAAQAPIGSNGVLFNPTMAGASPQEPGNALQGGFLGLTLSTKREDMLRAVLEGIALSLESYCLQSLSAHVSMSGPILITGGGARSPVWMQMFADIFGRPVRMSSIGQEATSLGAAAVAARGVGLIQSYDEWNHCWGQGKDFYPDPAAEEAHRKLRRRFHLWTEGLAVLQEQILREG